MTKAKKILSAVPKGRDSLLARQQITKNAMILLSYSMVTDDSDLYETALHLLASVKNMRVVYRPLHHRKRDDYFFTTKFYKYSDSEFLQNFRTTRSGFAEIVELIEDHPHFKNNSNHRQAHPAWQLAVTLMRLGHYGSRAAVGVIATDVGISAGAVTDWTNRVLHVLLSLAPEWIEWPSEKERRSHGAQMRLEGFPGCVGFIDGTTLPLYQKPALEGSAYFDRKKRYSVNAQIICNMQGRIIALHAGCPGSAADSTVFKRMDHFQHPLRFFSPGEYLLADSAYGISAQCIPSFKSPAADVDENTLFNYYLACSRVRNEHCIGVLKGRWQSLRELRHAIADDGNMEHLCHWVLACCVLHNIMGDINERWFVEEDDSYDRPVIDIEDITTVEGFAFREALKATTIETNRHRVRRQP